MTTAADSAIAFYFDMITTEHPEWPMQRMIGEIATRAGCNEPDVVVWMEGRLAEIEMTNRRSNASRFEEKRKV